MAAPNIVNVATITGKTATLNVVTAANTVVSNAAGSSKVFKINMLQVSNVDGVNDAEVTVGYYAGATLGGQVTELVKSVAVAANSSLVVIDKNTALYLEEDRSLGAYANTAGDLKIVCSYEEIS